MSLLCVAHPIYQLSVINKDSSLEPLFNQVILFNVFIVFNLFNQVLLSTIIKDNVKYQW